MTRHEMETNQLLRRGTINLRGAVALFVTLLLGVVAADVVIAGRQAYEGELVSDDEEAVVIRLENGTERTISRARVTEVMRDVDLAGYFERKVEELGEDADAIADLGMQAEKLRRKDIAQDIYRSALEVDPGQDLAGRRLRLKKNDEGVYVDPATLVSESPGAVATGDEGRLATVFYEVEENVYEDGEKGAALTWSAYLLRNPNPAFKSTVGYNFAGSFFRDAHKWGLMTEEAKRTHAPFHATIKSKIIYEGTNEWQGHVVQYWYRGVMTVEVVRASDKKVVLTCEAVADKGDHNRVEAARGALNRAARLLVDSKEIKQLKLWTEPDDAPAMKKTIRHEKLQDKNLPR